MSPHPRLQASILGSIVLCEMLVMTYLVPAWTSYILPLLPFGDQVSW